MAKDISTKVLCVKKIGWKRIAKNFMRFGWDLDDAEQETTITKTTEYEITETPKGYHAKPHTNTSTKVRIWLTFTRRKSDFENLAAVRPLELFYNLFFYARRIVGFVLPILAIATFVLALLGGASTTNDMGGYNTMVGWLLAVFGIWVGLILLETILARIAGKILRRK